ncbi:MAG: hypothetical protein HY998_00355 [candidate division NC10 bacterium]|nr:hypothetical protein [candidate division NC10 bacterium]
MANLYVREIPDDIYKALKEEAAKDRRSVNQEVVWILREYLSKSKKDQRDLRAAIDRRREELARGKGILGDSSLLIRKDRER